MDRKKKEYYIECDLIQKNKFENYEIVWDHPFFDKIKDEFIFITNINEIYKKNIIESNLICTKCSSKKIYAQTKQTRSSDEGETLFAICMDCKNKWTIRG